MKHLVSASFFKIVFVLCGLLLCSPKVVNAQKPIRHNTVTPSKPSRTPSRKPSKPSKPTSTSNSSKPTLPVPQAIDLGLSVKWASFNLGASSPEKYGKYYKFDATRKAVKSALGGKWRVPTKEEFQELISKCSQEFTTVNGIKGVRFTGPNGNYIFLPFSGYRKYSSNSFNDIGTFGYYWSSTISNPTICGDYLFLSSSTWHASVCENRATDMSVRPVLSE